jgi:hypothetical protein
MSPLQAKKLAFWRAISPGKIVDQGFWMRLKAVLVVSGRGHYACNSSALPAIAQAPATPATRL